MTATILRLEGIRKEYGAKPVLDIDALEVEKGSVHALVGPNGSGKTTLLEIAALISRPTHGSVSLLGEDCTADDRTRRRLRREVTLVDQNPYLFDTTVYRNMTFGLEARGVNRREIPGRVEEALDSVGLSPLAGRRASGLSAGEIQRIALARALALGPALLLLDEPTANVDLYHVQILENLVTKAVDRMGATVIFATHSLDQSYRLAGTIHHLVEGRLSATPPENHFFGIAGEEEGETVVRLAPGVCIVLPEARKGDIHFSIPPEEVVLSKDPPRSRARNTFQGRVKAMSDDGGRIQVTVDVGVNIVSVVTPKALDSLDLKVGDTISASVEVFSILLY